MKNPHRIAITNLLILNLLRSLIQPHSNRNLLLLLNLPALKHRILLIIQKQIPYLQPLIYLHIQESCRIERNISVDILLVVVAGV